MRGRQGGGTDQPHHPPTPPEQSGYFVCHGPLACAINRRARRVRYADKLHEYEVRGDEEDLNILFEGEQKSTRK